MQDFPGTGSMGRDSQQFDLPSISKKQEMMPEPSVAPTSAPGSLYVSKRDGTRTGFDSSKIKIAITKAYLAVEGGQMALSDSVHEQVENLTNEVTEKLKKRASPGGLLNIEDIQDQVELALMRAGEQRIARAYVIYREERAKARREAQGSDSEDANQLHGIHIAYPGGSQIKLEAHTLHQLIDQASRDLADIDHNLIFQQCVNNIYDGISYDDLISALVMTCHTLVEREPNYGLIAARFQLGLLINESNGVLGFSSTRVELEDLPSNYPQALQASIIKGIEFGLIDSQLAEKFDLQLLGESLLPERDQLFTYLGMRTIYDRYLLHYQDARYELPQVFFMRVAMGLSLQEAKPNESAIEYYRLLSSFDYMTSTPTLFNAGTVRSQLSSCYLTTIPDDLEGIFDAVRDNAMLSKWAGGLGNDWTQVRALGSRIKGTNGKSQGVVPFLKVASDTGVAVNQGGKRKGALCAYLETWHLDIEHFLELRKNTGDDRRRTTEMNTANWIPDLFMKRLFQDDAKWTLFSPSDTPDLHDLTGKAFEERYCYYEQQAEAGNITNFRRMPAKQLWRKMLGMVFETGHPWVTFKDACNLRSPQQHTGVVHSSNLCTEITLNTSADEIAVCNLGSINLSRHITDGKLDTEKLQRTIRTAVRMLDNVIDINYYAVPQAKNSNLRHRPVGLGTMGFHDALIMQGIPYASDEAVAFADKSMELISYYAIEASSDLAVERGSYPSYPGSHWSKGMVPIDSLKLLREERGAEYLEVDDSATLNWDVLRTKVRDQGMRNSNVLAIAPTATISNIVGASKSIDPIFQNLHVSSNLSGDFIMFSNLLVNDLKARKLWDVAMTQDLKYFEGDLDKIDRIPEDMKKLYATAFKIHPKWSIEAGARRQKWIDQAQSLNLYMAVPDGEMLDNMYRMAWYRGLKTTYYLRSLSATSAEKSTTENKSLNKVVSAPASPSLTSPAVCTFDEGCESCQ